MTLAGKTILVTGATGVLGAVTARTLAAQGASLWLGYHQAEVRAQALCEELTREHGRAVLPLRFDVTDGAAVDDAVEQMMASSTRLDALVYCSGVSFKKPLRTTSDEEMKRALAVNVAGAMACARATLPHLGRQRSSRILLVGSAASRGASGFTVYGASKAALDGLCRSAAIEYASAGVCVNVVAPARLEGSPFAEGERERLLPDYPMGRFIDPADVAALLAFLCSDAAGMITGQVIAIDGARR